MITLSCYDIISTILLCGIGSDMLISLNIIGWFLNTLIMKNVHAYESLMGTIVMFWNYIYILKKTLNIKGK
jgi:hypothetical protein